MGKKIYFRTTIVVIILIVAMLSIHFFNLLAIREVSFTDEWSNDFKISETEDSDFKVSALDEDLLNLSVNEPNTLDFNIISKDGSLISSGSNEIANFDFKKVNQSYLIGGKFIYLYENDVYLSEFSEDEFLEPVRLLEDVNYLTAKGLEDSVYLTTTRDEKVEVFQLKGQKTESIYTREGEYDLNYAYFIPDESDGSIVSIVNKGRESQMIQIGSLANDEQLTLEDVNRASGYSIQNLSVDTLDKKISISYILRINTKGRRTYSLNNIQVDKENLDIEKNEYDLSDYNITNLDSELKTYTDNNQLHMIASGNNLENRFSSDKNDIFKMVLKENGQVEDVTFISSTDNYSNKIALTSLNKDQYLVFGDIEPDKYVLRIIGNSDSMLDRESLTREDYTSVLLQISSIPFLSIMFTILRALILLAFMALPLFIFYLAYFNRGDSKDSIKTAGIIAIYVITNIISFGFIYLGRGNEGYHPAFFYTDYFRILGPIITNLLTALATLVFYRENKIKQRDISFIFYPVFFVVLDVFLNNLLYIRFSTLFMLFGF